VADEVICFFHAHRSCPRFPPMLKHSAQQSPGLPR
jgi:hypothetical protein